jgi:hypothetical protein
MMSPASLLFPVLAAANWILGSLLLAAAGLSGWAPRQRTNRSAPRSRAIRKEANQIARREV